MTATYDTKSWDLADAFLSEVEGSTDAQRHELACLIQETVEDYCNAMRPDYGQ